VEPYPKIIYLNSNFLLTLPGFKSPPILPALLEKIKSMFYKKPLGIWDILEHLGFAEALETLRKRTQMQMRYHDCKHHDQTRAYSAPNFFSIAF
jgi:hypothetical protein